MGTEPCIAAVYAYPSLCWWFSLEDWIQYDGAVTEVANVTAFTTFVPFSFSFRMKIHSEFVRRTCPVFEVGQLPRGQTWDILSILIWKYLRPKVRLALTKPDMLQENWCFFVYKRF